MEFEHDNVRQMVEEDRLSSLPDELIHKILYSFDMKFAVQTCVLSSRWKLLWTSMPYLNFSSGQFISLPKFSKFVKNVLSHRNHQIEVSSVKLDFNGAANEDFVRKIANYAFSHNVQELTVSTSRTENQKEFPPCLFSSESLKHFTLSTSCDFCPTPETPWDFPALTTLHISNIILCGDLFSKCVNLKNLTLKTFTIEAEEVFDIITPHLSNLTLIYGYCSNDINLIAPQLENLTIIECSINYLNAPPGLSSLYYKGDDPIQFLKDRLYSLDKVSVCVYYSDSYLKYDKEDARMTINMLQELHSAMHLTLNWDIVECLSTFSDLLSQHPSPFSNLICLTVSPGTRMDAYRVKMSSEARNFFLLSSPDAIMELPETAEIESHMNELEELIEEGKMEQKGRNTETERLLAQFKDWMGEMRALVKEEREEVKAITSKEAVIRSLLENLPERKRAEVEARYSQLREETKAHSDRLLSQIVTSETILACERLLSDDDISISQDASSSKHPLAP